jgi:hypothetical protein
MAKNAEPELRVLVEDLPLRNVVAEMSGDERIVLQNLLDQRADFLAALDTGIVRQDVITSVRKLRESIAHQPTSSLPTSRLYAAGSEPILAAGFAQDPGASRDTERTTLCRLRARS